MAKQLKGPWNWPENLIKNNNLENEKELINFLKKIIKVSPKVKKKIECFNCGGLGHFFIHFPSPKDIKKSMQTTWSDTNSKKKVIL